MYTLFNQNNILVLVQLTYEDKNAFYSLTTEIHTEPSSNPL